MKYYICSRDGWKYVAICDGLIFAAPFDYPGCAWIFSSYEQAALDGAAWLDAGYVIRPVD